MAAVVRNGPLLGTIVSRPDKPRFLVLNSSLSIGNNAQIGPWRRKVLPIGRAGDQRLSSGRP